jgi:hypothetical protein
MISRDANSCDVASAIWELGQPWDLSRNVDASKENLCGNRDTGPGGFIRGVIIVNITVNSAIAANN